MKRDSAPFKTGATALRLRTPILIVSQRSRDGNVGLKDATTLWLVLEANNYQSSTDWLTLVSWLNTQEFG